MANVILAWELGGGVGHVVNLLPLARALVLDGHSVHLILRDSARVERLFNGINVQLWQAPFKSSSAKQPIAKPRTYAEIISNCGFGDQDELTSLVRAWHSLFNAIQPQLIVADHSPTALLAAQIWDVPAVAVGEGFCCPPADTPFKDLRPWTELPLSENRASEEKVLANCNHVLTRFGCMPWVQPSQLLKSVRKTFLFTAQELDPYAPRTDARYLGSWPPSGGNEPAWPLGIGRRIFAYLKPFPALPALLATLANLELPCLIVADGIDQQVQKQFARPWLRFENEPVDIRKALAQCFVAICNANHGTVCALLQAGTPALHLPLHLEQMISAYFMQQRGLGLVASIRNNTEASAKLLQLLNDDTFSTLARAHAVATATYDESTSFAYAHSTLNAILAAL